MRRAMPLHQALVVARVFSRLGEQGERAWTYGREDDARGIWRIQGKLEAAIFGFPGCLLDAPPRKSSGANRKTGVVSLAKYPSS